MDLYVKTHERTVAFEYKISNSNRSAGITGFISLFDGCARTQNRKL